MWNNLFKHIDILPENAHLLDGNAPDLEKECEEYEKQITEAGGIELFLGGICYSYILNNVLCVICNKCTMSEGIQVYLGHMWLERIIQQSILFSLIYAPVAN